MPAEEPTHDELVQHLMRCMQQEGITVEAADAPGHSRPRPVKLLGLRPGRLRPDVVGRDGRRMTLGKAISATEIADSSLPGRLETFARHCRMLVVCVPGSAADEAIATLFHGQQLPHRAKLRLLVHPRMKWEDVPKPPARAR